MNIRRCILVVCISPIHVLFKNAPDVAEPPWQHLLASVLEALLILLDYRKHPP